MRLIGQLENEAQAFTFYAFLREMGIHATYEPIKEGGRFSLWIYEEDEIERAVAFLNEFKANPQDPKFHVDAPGNPPIPPDEIAKATEQKYQRTSAPPKKKKRYPLTSFTIMICAFLYFLSAIAQVHLFQQGGMIRAQMSWTKVQQVFMFDYPLANQKLNALLAETDLKSYKKLDELPQKERAAIRKVLDIPTWKGILPILLNKWQGKEDNPALHGPLFQSIRKGQIYRLFTPCLLHGGLLHILFNMAWVWILMRQLEERLTKTKLLLFILGVGIIANIAQYFISGPYFLGFSGVVVGMVGFIWVRQKVAPWEGYPLQKGAVWFVTIYVIVMLGLELFSLLRALAFEAEQTLQIANTAHIVGGITGALFGRFSVFARGFHK